jgi:hypothetical protein
MRLLPLLALVAALLAGCSGQPGTGTLTGKIRLGKTPLKVANITVVSEDGKRRAVGTVLSDDGTYVVEKAPAGKVKLAVSVPTPQELTPPPEPDKLPGLPGTAKGVGEPPSAPGMPEDVRAHLSLLAKKVIPIPAVYANPDESNLGTTVEANQDNVYDIVLKR